VNYVVELRGRVLFYGGAYSELFVSANGRGNAVRFPDLRRADEY
jgi:hypothetical protein